MCLTNIRETPPPSYQVLPGQNGGVWEFEGEYYPLLTFPTLLYSPGYLSKTEETEAHIERYLNFTPWTDQCGRVDPNSIFPTNGQKVMREVEAVEKNRAQFRGKILMVPPLQPGFETAVKAFLKMSSDIDSRNAKYICGVTAIMFAIAATGTSSMLRYVPDLRAFRDRASFIYPTTRIDGKEMRIKPEKVLPNTIYRERLMEGGCSFDFTGIRDPSEIIRIYNSLGQNMRMIFAVIHDEPCYALNGYTHWYTLLKVIKRGVSGFDNIEQLPHLLATEGLNELAHDPIDTVGSLGDQYAVLAGELGPLGISETPFCVVPLHNLLQSTTAVIGHVPRPTDRRAGEVLRTTQIGGLAFRENICVVSVP